MSHTVLLELNLREGKTEEFLPLLIMGLADTRAREGFESIEVLVDQDDPTRVFLWEKWTERAHQEAYVAWRMETGSEEALASFVSGPPIFTHMETRES